MRQTKTDGQEQIKPWDSFCSLLGVEGQLQGYQPACPPSQTERSYCFDAGRENPFCGAFTPFLRREASRRAADVSSGRKLASSCLQRKTTFPPKCAKGLLPLRPTEPGREELRKMMGNSESMESTQLALPKHILDIWAIVLIILGTIVIMTLLVLCPATTVIIYRVWTHPMHHNGAE